MPQHTPFGTSADDIRAILDVHPCLAWSVLPDGSLEFFNCHWSEYTAMDDVAGQWGWTQAIHEDDRPRLMMFWNSPVESNIEVRLRRYDGNHAIFRIRRSSVTGATGSVVRWYVTATAADARPFAESGSASAEEDFRSFLDSVPGLMYVVSAAGGIELANRRALEYFRSTAEEVKHWRDCQWIHPADRRHVRESLRRSVETGDQWDSEHRILGGDGVYRWFHHCGIRRLDSKVQKLHWLVLLTPIDDRWKLEDRLLDSERLLVETQRLSRSGTWKQDLISGKVSVTSGIEQLFAIAPDEDASDAEFFLSRIHPEDRSRQEAAYQRAVREKSGFDCDYRIVVQGGSTRYVRAACYPRLNDDGEVTELVTTAVDVTEQESARAELRATSNTIPALAWSTRPDGFVDFLNERWLDYTGLCSEQALGYDWTAALHPEDFQGLVGYWQSLMSSGEAGEYPARLRRSDGAYRWFLFHAAPLRDESGRIIKWYGTNTDVEDLKRAEEALRASEQKFRLIVETTPALGCTLSARWEVEHANRRFLDYFGRTFEQLKEWVFIGVVHPDDFEHVVARCRHSAETGEPYDVEHRCRRHDGEYRWFHIRGLPLRDGHGHIQRWYILLIDIEDRRRAEEALRASERALRSIIDTIPTLAWSARPDGSADFFNKRWLEYTGFSAEEAQGSGWSTAFHPEDAQRMLEYWRASLASGSPVDTEVRVRRFDGTYRWFILRANPLRDDSGEITRWYGTNIDIEDRKQAHEALQASERELSLIIEAIPGFVWCASPAGDFTYLNHRILAYTGASLEDWAHGGWTSFLHPADVEATVEGWSQAIATGQPHEIQCRLRRSDGVYRCFHMLGQATCSNDGSVIRWYGLLLDIEDRKKIEETLRDTQERLTRSTQLATFGELAASIAHEVNQPLAAVVASGHACLRFLGARPPDVAGACEAAESIVRDGKDAAEVVRRTRALFKRGAVEKSWLNVNDVIGEVLRLLAGEIARREISVQTDLPGDVPLVAADRVQLQQLILNLVRNGMEAMASIDDRPRKLCVRSGRETPTSLFVEVSDNGVGLVNREDVFEAFVTTKAHGMGMGLTICRSIVEAHNGRLWAAPKSGHGATFCFTLPVSMGAEQ
ncbi:MAG TPA: PAS domain-containing protein [Bryobacteraceae bacterium]|nr:PAS domain-containing protein [Bryobacteraceae bacterium]